ATRQVMTGGGSRPLRAIGGFLLRPWVAVISFILAMVIWHLPGPFDLGTRNEAVHIWLVHGSFFATGVLFWLQFVPSVPFRIAMSRAAQAAALVVTNVQMCSVPLSMSFRSSGSGYSVSAIVPGVPSPPLADQQLG